MTMPPPPIGEKDTKAKVWQDWFRRVPTEFQGIEAFPIGSIFIAAVSTNPATLLGYGTWAAFGAGRVLVGIDTGQSEFDTLLETGGTKTHTLTEAEIPAHTHTQSAHNHGQQVKNTGTAGVAGTQGGDAADDTSVGTTDDATAVNQNTGGGGAHNNLQPYVVVYMWRRTA